MRDALSVFIATTTASATLTSAALSLPSGTPRRGLKASVLITAISAATGTPTLASKVQGSPDGTTYYDLAFPQNGALSTVSTACGISIPFESTAEKFFRVVLTLAGGSTTPSFTVYADLQDGRSGA